MRIPRKRFGHVSGKMAERKEIGGQSDLKTSRSSRGRWWHVWGRMAETCSWPCSPCSPPPSLLHSPLNGVRDSGGKSRGRNRRDLGTNGTLSSVQTGLAQGGVGGSCLEHNHLWGRCLEEGEAPEGCGFHFLRTNWRRWGVGGEREQAILAGAELYHDPHLWESVYMSQITTWSK